MSMLDEFVMDLDSLAKAWAKKEQKELAFEVTRRLGIISRYSNGAVICALCAALKVYVSDIIKDP